MHIWRKYSEKLKKHLLRGLFCYSCGITYHSLLKVKSNKRALLEISVSKHEKSSHVVMNENVRFKQLQLNYINHKKKTRKKKKRKEHLTLVLSSIRVGAVAKTDDENYVLGTMKIYIVTFHLFPILCQRRSSCWKYRKWWGYFENRYRHAKTVERKRKDFSVSPYCTLLFSRKKNIKFPEVTLVTDHCNCLTNCIMIARGFRPWNTANTTADNYLLVENSN